jgi:hypothetical protein
VRRALLITALALAAAAPLALAQGENPYQTSSYTLSQERPNKSTSERFLFDYVDPANQEGKPPAVRKVTTILPKGARYDTAVPLSCEASDDQLMLAGGSACPDASRIGGGVVTVDTGGPEPGRIVTADVEFFNNAPDEFIYLNTIRGSSARTIIRAEVTDRLTITETGMLPGTPPEGGSIDTVDVTVEGVSRKLDGKRRNYITTPRRCPKDRTWTTRVRFEYDGGVAQTVPTENPCRKPRR